LVSEYEEFLGIVKLGENTSDIQVEIGEGGKHVLIDIGHIAALGAAVVA
jgi:hypothetical protein